MGVGLISRFSAVTPAGACGTEFLNHPEDAVPARVITLDSAHNRTGDVWHNWAKGICSVLLYAYRVDGP